jgi:golgi phosphoprotein 3
VEEVVLLTVDERTGRLRSTREFATTYALVGALFFDLALARKIDTDTESVQVIDTTPTGNTTLDRVLAHMAQRSELTTVKEWIEEIYRREDDLEGEVLRSLIARGVLRHEKSKRLWIIDVERFPMVDNKPQQHTKVRLARAILSDEIPPARHIMLVSIAEACGLLGYVLTDDQRAARRNRIQMLCNLETISRKVTDAIHALETKSPQAMTNVPHSPRLPGS